MYYESIPKVTFGDETLEVFQISCARITDCGGVGNLIHALTALSGFPVSPDPSVIVRCKTLVLHATPRCLVPRTDGRINRWQIVFREQRGAYRR